MTPVEFLYHGVVLPGTHLVKYLDLRAAALKTKKSNAEPYMPKATKKYDKRVFRNNVTAYEEIMSEVRPLIEGIKSGVRKTERKLLGIWSYSREAQTNFPAILKAVVSESYNYCGEKVSGLFKRSKSESPVEDLTKIPVLEGAKLNSDSPEPIITTSPQTDTINENHTSSTATITTITIEPKRTAPKAIKQRPAPIKNTYLKFDLSEIKDKSSEEVAEIILQKIREQNIPCKDTKKAYLLLQEIAKGTPFEIAALKFFSPERKHTQSFNLDEIKDSAIRALNNFLPEVIENRELITQTIEALTKKEEIKIQLFDEPKEATTGEPKLEPADIVLVETYPKRANIKKDPSKLMDEFLLLTRNEEGIFTSLNTEELRSRLVFLDEVLKLGANPLPVDINALNSEYTAYKEYSEITDDRRFTIERVLRSTTNFELASFSSKRDMAIFLEKMKLKGEEGDSVHFLIDLAKLDSLHVRGIKRLFKKAFDNQGENIGHYEEAMLAVKFKEQRPAAKISLAESLGEIKDIDIILEEDGVRYYIEVKNSYQITIDSSEKIEKLAKVVCEADKRKPDKILIPVCLIYDKKNEYNNLLSGRNVLISSQLGKITGIADTYPNFEVWNRNGENILISLRRCTTSASFRGKRRFGSQ